MEDPARMAARVEYLLIRFIRSRHSSRSEQGTARRAHLSDMACGCKQTNRKKGDRQGKHIPFKNSEQAQPKKSSTLE
jgi:hypothetical protein